MSAAAHSKAEERSTPRRKRRLALLSERKQKRNPGRPTKSSKVVVMSERLSPGRKSSCAHQGRKGRRGEVPKSEKDGRPANSSATASEKSLYFPRGGEKGREGDRTCGRTKAWRPAPTEGGPPGREIQFGTSGGGGKNVPDVKGTRRQLSIGQKEKWASTPWSAFPKGPR